MQVKHIEKSQGGAGSFRVGKKRKGGWREKKSQQNDSNVFQRLSSVIMFISRGCRVSWSRM